MDVAECCQHCGQLLTKGKRFKIHPDGPIGLVLSCFFDLIITSPSFVCGKCFRLLNKLNKTKIELDARRKEDGDTSTSSSSKCNCKKRKHESPMMVSYGTKHFRVPQTSMSTVNWIVRRKYTNASKALARQSVAGAEGIVNKTIAQESRYYCKTTKYKGLAIFPFATNSVYDEFRQKCPTLCSTMLSAVAPKMRNQAGPRVIAAAAMLLQTRNRKVNHMQKLISLLLWKGKVRSMTFRRLNFLGLCTSRPTIIRCIDEMSKAYDSPVRSWREAIAKQEMEKEEQPQATSITQQEVMHEDQAVSTTQQEVMHEDHSYVVTPQSSAETSFPSLPELARSTATCARTFTSKEFSHGQDKAVGFQDKQITPGYQLVFDNVNIHQRKRHKTSQNKNQQLNMIQVFAVQDRVNLEHLPNDQPILSDVRALSCDAWWLPPNEQTLMKEELKVLIGRIIVRYMPCFKEYEVDHHIQHSYSAQTSSKSKVNKLGIINLDEMSSDDMTTFMEEMQQYCPKTEDGRMVKIPLGGDGLSCEKAYSVQKARLDSFCEEDKLTGLIPKPEDWHEGVITLQDIFTAFYKTRSSREIGTLYNLREVFDRRGVKASAKDAVNDNREFIKFITHGFVVLAAMNVLDLDKFDELPVDIPRQEDSKEERQTYLHSVVTKIVDRYVFPDGILPSGRRKDIDPEDYKYNYTCALMREGLLDIARLDAVKEGDGERIIRHWRYDFIHFNAYNHPKYRLLSFRMIVQVFGLLTPRMAARMMHNRTINIHGGIGHNISLDIFLEFLNRDVKDDTRRSGPNLTPRLLERIGRSKQVLDELLHVFDQEMELFTGIGRHSTPDWSDEVSQMVMDLKDEELFKPNPGRMFPSFPRFPFNKVHALDRKKLEAWVTEQLTILQMSHSRQK